MQIVEELTAQMFVDQLSPQEKAAVDRIYYILGSATDISQVPRIKRLHTGSAGRSLYTIPAGRDLRIVFSIEGNRVIVADVIRRSQIDGLQLGRRLQ
jgi:hypothetical protein